MNERTNIVRLIEHYPKTFNATTSNKINLTNRLTNNNADPEMKNAILDITDVPIDFTTFNTFLLDLIKKSHLIVVDDSHEHSFASGELTYYDRKTETMITENYRYLPYPKDIEIYYEQLGITKEDFVKNFERGSSAIEHFKYRNPSEGDFTIEKHYSEGIVYRRRIRTTKITVRQDVIDRVTYRRDGELSSIPLRQFIKEDEEVSELTRSSNVSFDEEALKETLEHINEHFSRGNTTMPIFNTKGISTNKSSKLNIAKLIILANEFMEFSDLSSGQGLIMEGATFYAMQLLYDFTSFNAFVEDFNSKFSVGDTFVFFEGSEVDRLTLLEKVIVEHQSGVDKIIYRCESKLGKERLARNPDAKPETVKLEVEVDLYRLYNCNSLVLPLGIILGTSEGMPSNEERTKYFDKTDFKEFVKTINVDGISPLISSTFDFSSSSNYTVIYHKAMEVMYEQEGWGKVPELDLLKIVKGEDSPFTINL